MELRFATGNMGCVLPLLAVCIVAFGVAAARPGFLGHGRRRALAELANGATVGGIAVLWLLPAGLLLWWFVRLGHRWADGVAATASQRGISFHPSLRARPAVWDEVEDVRIETRRANWVDVREIVLELRHDLVRIRGFEDDDGAAEAFVAAVRARLNRPA
ncbi:hypothetical protein [Sphingomonas parva]|uniref:hypothetical protein n=1 Tax=Sphingomonas parva TaxID=2555898 RepID=UPI0010746020|nr:hypothetical protein [Sphingomonas parva]